jgi:alpha-glucosidase
MPAPSNGSAWWRDGVLYQIYVRSFADSNGDGIGDLDGITGKLDHLAWLGVDGIWLSPIGPSPNRDWGYDVAGYRDVDPDLGDLAALERLVAEAGTRGIRVVLDLVPNHTSDRHPWFVEARTSRHAPHRDWYVWAPARPDGSPPNNWQSIFGGSAWQLDEASGEYYLHNFHAEQPDLNWWNEDVRREFEDVLRFWFDRGVAGFRIDVAHGLVKDRELRDNPLLDAPAVAGTLPRTQEHVYNMNRPEVHDVYRAWRTIANAYEPPRVLVGETWVPDVAALAPYYGTEDELHLCFNFAFTMAAFEAETLRGVVESTEAVLAPRAQPAWTASNHDIGRLATRWCDGREDRIRCALMAIVLLRGTPFVYAGDEIGLQDVSVPAEDLRDAFVAELAGVRGRDGCRTPMVWADEPGAGFTAPEVRPWLPIGDRSRNVAAQREDPASTLHFCRDVIALRRGNADLASGPYETVPSPDGVWAWRRGAGTIVALNLSDAAASLRVGAATVLLATDRARDGGRVDGPLEMQPWSGVVLRAEGQGAS